MPFTAKVDDRSLAELAWLRAHYPPDCWPQNIEPLGSAGGFSGARLWRLQSPRGSLLLRRWPADSVTAERLEWIHDVLGHVSRNAHIDGRPAADTSFRPTSTPPVPAPVPLAERRHDGRRQTFLLHLGHFWELTPWLPGRADFWPEKQPQKLTAALAALAHFHLASQAFGGHGLQPKRPSPGLQRRHAQTQALLSGGLRELIGAIDRLKQHPAGHKHSALPGFDMDQRGQLIALAEGVLLPALAVHAGRVERELTTACEVAVPQFPCLRDIWHDHVLFVGDRVSGLVDFGAMSVETVAGDIARLLASLIGNDLHLWSLGLAAYQAVRPLDLAEQRLISVFDLSGRLLAADNWLRWLSIEGRRFADAEAVLARISQVAAALQVL